MKPKDYEIFEGKNLEDLFKEIYTNVEKKNSQIKALVEDLRGFIHNISDATMLVPIIKEYLDISVKNDDQLIKMAQIVQRLIQAENRLSQLNTQGENLNSNMPITEEEKRQLLQGISGYTSELRKMVEEQKNKSFVEVKENVKSIPARNENDSE